MLVAVQRLGALKLIFEQIFFCSAKIKSNVFKQRNKMKTEDRKNMFTYAKSKRSVGRGPAAFAAGAGVALCSWLYRARETQGFPWACHEPATGTKQNLACFLQCVTMLWVTTRHLRGIRTSPYSGVVQDDF